MRRRFITFVATIALVVPGLGAAPAAAATDGAGLQAALDRITAAGLPGTFAEVRDNRSTWRGASGVADVATGRPMRPGFQHRVASITKTFVATTVLQLAAERRISLDAPLGRYLPEYARDGLTVRMLLNHTGGVANYIDVLLQTLNGQVVSGSRVSPVWVRKPLSRSSRYWMVLSRFLMMACR